MNSADTSSNKFVFGQNMSERVLVSIHYVYVVILPAVCYGFSLRNFESL